MLIGVLSDTHWICGRPVTPALELLRAQQPDMILHAGDILNTELLDDLSFIAPTYAVAGNNDDSFARRLPKKMIVNAGDVRIGLIHGYGYGRAADVAFSEFIKDDVKVIVYGHSHIPDCEWRNGILMFNPGACSRPRSVDGRPSYGLLEVADNGEITGKIIYFNK